MRGHTLKKMVFLLFVAVLVGGFVMPASFADSGSSHIFVLDREPFYSPSSWRLQSGQTVRWQNRSMQPHTITHDGCGQRGGCAFHSGHLHPGEEFAVRDLDPGNYPYHCNIHPFMRGKIVVDQAPIHNFNRTEL